LSLVSTVSREIAALTELNRIEWVERKFRRIEVPDPVVLRLEPSQQ
jgi:hypothetical protein